MTGMEKGEGMELSKRLEEALKEAIRNKDATRRDAIRMAMTGVKNKEKDLRRAPNDAEIEQIIGSQIKQRKDSIEQYLQGGRPELAAKEEEEMKILMQFLPEQLSTETLERIVSEAVAESGATSAKEIGKVMKVLMPKVSGKADGKLVNELVRRKLGA
ncbi:MAG: GatB/YqeY domain-containing protein [Syntrophobacteraceae bacterium]